MSSHRPYPIERSPWVMGMSWHDLLFAHWPVPAASLRPLIPPALEIDEFDRTAWIAVVPFRMSAVRPRFIPSLPWISRFAELNVRTYVRAGGKPGVWFFSLDAANPVAVRAARISFALPYFDARMSIKFEGDSFEYSSQRTHRGAPAAEFKARYGPTGVVYHSAPGSLEHFLTERYCLYSARPNGTLLRGEVDHIQWPLQPAQAQIELNTMTAPIGIALPHIPPLLHFASRLDVTAWWPNSLPRT